MRGCETPVQTAGRGEESARGRAAPGGSGEPGRKTQDRLASFRPRAGEAVAGEGTPAVQTRLRHQGVEVAAYEDGGRVLRSTGGTGARPGTGTIGLLTLASSRIGDSTGRQACDPYRVNRPEGPRHLVLLVDTSGSIVATRQVPAVIVCAAGAALAALSRGFPVTVANFSRETIFYRTSRSSEIIYTAISRVQGETTILPRLSLLPLGPGGNRDYVLISDTAIHNLKEVLPDYQRALLREPHSRAQLFVLGEGNGREVAALEQAGFQAERVEAPGPDFRRFVARTLEGLLPPLRRLPDLQRVGRRTAPAPRPAARPAEQTGTPPSPIL